MSCKPKISKAPMGRILQSWLDSSTGVKYANNYASESRQRKGINKENRSELVTLKFEITNERTNYAKLKCDFDKAMDRIRCLEEILSATRQLEGSSTETGPSLLQVQAKFIEEEKERSKRIVMLNRFLAVAKQKCLSLQGQLDEVIEQKEQLQHRLLQLEKSMRVDRAAESSDATARFEDASSEDGRRRGRDSTKFNADDPNELSACKSSCTEESFSFSDFLDEEIDSCKADIQSLGLKLSEPLQADLLTRLETVLSYCQRWLKLPPNHSLWDEQAVGENGQDSHKNEVTSPT